MLAPSPPPHVFATINKKMRSKDDTAVLRQRRESLLSDYILADSISSPKGVNDTQKNTTAPGNTRLRKRSKSEVTVPEKNVNGIHHNYKKLDFELHLNHILEKMEAMQQRGFNSVEYALNLAQEYFNEEREFCRAKLDDFRTYIHAQLSDLSEARSNAGHQFMSYLNNLENKLAELEQSSLDTFNATKDSIQDAAALMRLAIKNGAMRLLTAEEIPEEWKHNMYILTGYRFYESKLRCVRSICGIHNETGNIWTHIIGFVFLAAVWFYYYPAKGWFAELSAADIAVYGVFFAAALKCLLFSTLWHTFCNLSNLKAMRRCACIDYIGISVLIAASIVTFEYHGFYCQPHCQLMYISITSLLGLIGTYIPWQEWFDKPKYRNLRILFFFGIGFSALIPLSHLFLTRGPIQTIVFLAPIAKSLISYCVGVFLYAKHWPEAFAPGKFDTIGNSHQIWHLLTLAGIWYHFRAVQSFGIKRSLFSCQSA